MLSKSDFQTWAKANVVPFASVMTRIEGRKDDALLRTYGFSGFPSFAVLDANGKVLNKNFGERSLAGMQSAVKKAQDFQNLVVAAEKDKSKRPALFLASLDIGRLTVKEAKAQMAELKMSDAQMKSAKQKVCDMDLNTMMRGMRRNANTEKAEAAVYAYFKDGIMPAKGAPTQMFYSDMLLKAAEKNKDAKALKAAYPGVISGLKSNVSRYKGFLKNPRYSRSKTQIEAAIEQMSKRIKDLEAKAAKAMTGEAGK